MTVSMRRRQLGGRRQECVGAPLSPHATAPDVHAEVGEMAERVSVDWSISGARASAYDGSVSAIASSIRPQISRRPHRASGFGLVELLATVAVVAVLAGIAVPSMADLLARARIAAAANDLVHAVAAARSEAIRHGQPFTLCRTLAADAPDAACEARGSDWSRGWLLVPGTGDSGEAARHVRALDGQTLAISFNAPTGARLTFAPTGQPAGSFAGGTFHLCPRGRPDLGHSVVVSRGGRVRVAVEPCA